MQLNTLRERAAKSIVALVSRTFLLNIINLVGTIVLTIHLTRGEFGIFVITSAIIEILVYFSDVGLAGALIQAKANPKSRQIHATFTIQQILVLSLIALALIFTVPIQNFYGLNQEATWLYYALLVSFFLSSLKTIPSVISERKLQFDKIIIPQIVETLLFNILLIAFAVQGYGLMSYIVAVIVRALSGAITIYLLVPYRPRFHLSFQDLQSLLKFGIPYQANTLLAVFKDKISLLILGKIIGVEGMGVLGWAEKWANLPLRYILDATNKVTFPLFSRLQDDLKRAQRNLERAVYFISLLVFPMLVGGYLIMPLIVATIPEYTKWESGLTSFNLFLISAAVAAISTFLTNFLTGIGKVRQVFGLMIMWTILTLTLYPFLASQYGFVGVALGSVLIATTSIVPLIMVRRIIPIRIIQQLWPSILASVVMFISIRFITLWLSDGYLGMIQIILLGGLSYSATLYLIDRHRLTQEITNFINLAYRKKEKITSWSSLSRECETTSTPGI